MAKYQCGWCAPPRPMYIEPGDVAHEDGTIDPRGICPACAMRANRVGVDTAELWALLHYLPDDPMATHGWARLLEAYLYELEEAGLTSFGNGEAAMFHLVQLARPCALLREKHAVRNCRRAGKICAVCSHRARSAIEITGYVTDIWTERTQRDVH